MIRSDINWLSGYAAQEQPNPVVDSSKFSDLPSASHSAYRRGIFCPMATDYEKDWPSLRLDWAAEKIREWQALLLDENPTLVEKRKLESDIVKMKLALKGWQRDKA